MIYLDNGSTSFPKAEGMSEFVKKFLDERCFNINRGAYSSSTDTSELVYDTREKAAEFFGGEKGKKVIFTSGVTFSLNLVLNGLLGGGDKAVTTYMEHNAVLRPLSKLAKQGTEVNFVSCDKNGEIDLNDLEEKLKQNPKVCVVTHASNVCGTIMPIKEIGKLCRRYGVIFVVDAAQTAGVVDIDMNRDNIDVLCFTGHKGLLGMQGIGGVIFGGDTAEICSPFCYGGTGSFSHTTEMPKILPDKFEAGTLNLPGIASLNYCFDFLKQKGIQNIFAHEKKLQALFEEGVKQLDNVQIIGGKAKNRCAVTSLDFKNVDNGEASFVLDTEYSIMTRSGLHCAPYAHKTLGTFPRGTVRFAFGYKTTEEEVKKAIQAVAKI